MSNKHTPGPWRFHANGDANDYTILGPDDRWVIGFIQNGEIWKEEQLANAKLIAACPTMLKELQHIVERINTVAVDAIGDKVSSAFCIALKDRANEIIKKATE